MSGAHRSLAIFACIFLSIDCSAQAPGSRAIPVQVASGLVYMRGEVNDSLPLSVVLDTGSSISIVSPAVAKAIGLASSQTTQAAGLGKGTDETLHLFDDGELRWGDNPTGSFQLSHQAGAILPIDYIAEQVGKPTDAIFGSNVFLHYTVTIDYDHEKVTFTPAAAATPSSGECIPIQLFGNVPFVTATIQGENGKNVTALFFVDSGTTGAMILSRAFLDAHPGLISESHLVDTPAVTAVGGKIHTKRAEVPQIRIGSFSFSRVVAGVPEMSAGPLTNKAVAGIIGAGILRRFTVTWDYTRKRVYLSPNGAYKTPFETDSSGLHLVASKPDYKDVVVDSVLPGSPAALVGIMPGDRIVAVDDVRSAPLWQVSEALRKTGRSILLTVQRGDTSLQVTVHLLSPFSLEDRARQ